MNIFCFSFSHFLFKFFSIHFISIQNIFYNSTSSEQVTPNVEVEVEVEEDIGKI